MTRQLIAVLCAAGMTGAHAAVVEMESNDSFMTAQTLAITDFSANSNIFDATTVAHESVAGSIGTANDVDYYAFNVGAGDIGYFDIDTGGLTGALSDSTLALFDAGENLLAFDDDSAPADPGTPASGFDSFIGEYTFTAAGLYYLAVAGFNNQPLLFGTAMSSLTRPDGGFGGSTYAGDSGSTMMGMNNGSATGAYNLHVSLQPVPVPAAIWLLGSGMLAVLGGATRRKSCARRAVS